MNATFIGLLIVGVIKGIKYTGDRMVKNIDNQIKK
jgi:hypothetical protein